MLKRYGFPALLSLTLLAHAAAAYGAPAQASPSDPPVGSPSGSVYELPFEQGRADAAPKGNGGVSAPGNKSAGGSGAEQGSLYRSENNFGSSSKVPGAPSSSGGGNGGGGTAGGSGGTAGGSSSGPASGGPGGGQGGSGGGAGTGGGSGAGAGSTAALASGAETAHDEDAGNTSSLATIALLAGIALVAAAIGVFAARASRLRAQS